MEKSRCITGGIVIPFVAMLVFLTACGKSEFKQWKEKGLSAASPEEKIECFTKALDCWTEKDGAVEKAKVYAKRGNAYSEKGHYDVALGDYDRAIALDVNCSEAVNGRANTATIREGVR